MSLQQTEAECAANAVAPRISLENLENAIAARYDLTGAEAVEPMNPRHHSLDRLSLCIVVLTNGFVIVGKSAPASAANFNRELGRKLAYEDAIRQLWPLMGFLLCDQLAKRDASLHTDTAMRGVLGS